MNKRHFFAGLGQAVNRAMRLNNTGSLAEDASLPAGGEQFGPRDLFLGTGAWRLETRVRLNAASTDGFSAIGGRITSEGLAEWAIYWETSTQQFAFDSFQYNNTGGLIYERIPVAAPIGQWYKVVFDYDGTTLRGYLNDTLAYTKALSFGFVNSPAQNLTLGSGQVNQYRATMDVDYYRLWVAGQLRISLDFNETAGQALNTGTLGSSMGWAMSNPRILV